MRTSQAFIDYGRSGELVLRKRGKKLDVIFTGEFIGDQGSTVRWRIDKGPIHTEHWLSSSDDASLFSPNPYAFLKALEKVGDGHTLMFEYKPYEYLPITIPFDLPAAVPDDFQGIAGKVVAKQEQEQEQGDAKDELIHEYYQCILDKSRSGSSCGDIAKQLLDRYGVDVNANKSNN